VHRILGPGFIEKIYERALIKEFTARVLPHRSQVSIDVGYKGELVGCHKLDLIVGGQVVVELKAVQAIDDAHLATCLSYLKATGLPVGLIINFGRVKTQVRRVLAPSILGTRRKGGEEKGRAST
jgi:GxxExxY protein